MRVRHLADMEICPTAPQEGELSIRRFHQLEGRHFCIPHSHPHPPWQTSRLDFFSDYFWQWG